MAFWGLFGKKDQETLDRGMEKTRKGMLDKLAHVVAGKSKVDDDVLDELEEVLITSDVGVDTTLRIIERIEARVARDKYVGSDELNKILREEIVALLDEMEEMGILSRPNAEGNRYLLRRRSFIDVIGTSLESLEHDIETYNEEAVNNA